MLNVLLKAAGYLLTLGRLGLFVVGQKIFSDSVGHLVLMAGAPIVGFLRNIMGITSSIFMGFFGLGNWAQPEPQYVQQAA